MAIEVRTYTDADAGALADLLNRNAYGPAEFGTTLTAEQVRQVFAERRITECIVGDDGTELRGCIALAIGSGRRAAAPHERFAGLFVIDDRYRNSMLAGKLFREVFADRIRAGGVRTLRIEANPANVRAFPLYLRVGFRARPGARPDEDGYVELVSHLPGVIDDLIRANPGADVDEVAVKLNWRMMRAGRDVDPAAGVVVRDGRLVVDYPIDTGDLELTAVVDHELGTVLALEQTSGTPIASPAEATVSAPEPCSERERIALADGHALVIFDDGTIELHRNEPGRAPTVLLRERWPVALGEDAPAVRRQGHRRRIRVHEVTDAQAQRWQLVADDDAVTREVRIGHEGHAIDLVTSPNRDVVALTAPWVTMRVAEHALRDDGGEWRGGPVLPGLWPNDWGDFEAAREPLAATAAWWSDGITSMRLGWTGIARADSRSAPALHSAHPGAEVHLRIELGAETPPLTTNPEGLHRVTAALRRRRVGASSTAEPALVVDTAPTRLDTVAERGTVRELHYGEQQLRVATDAGLIDWRVGDTTVLRGPYPSATPFGSLATRRTGLWCTPLAARDDADQGVEWAEDREALRWTEATIGTGPQPGSWQLEALGASGLRVRADAAAAETAIHLVPDTGGAGEFVISVLGRRWRVDPGHPWRGAVDAAAIVLRDGRALVLVPTGARAELFLRAMTTGVLVTALAAGPLDLRMHVVESRAQAERFLASAARGGEA
ncbi:GNAT family N-acetyltransferase [Gulosibacter macacae]|uniref:GNAT family N-acetyltransferase n=1 Tax=Gulosibacter macacae TaxID=2488791 RepID=A0A3P3VYM2_9MICO|nr:GNAT family N-acetyltransferase [Gulosibacter macacae]RRJ87584.1 GNAT family N-acetyltransferase [Gulosibacter macacae]